LSPIIPGTLIHMARNTHEDRKTRRREGAGIYFLRKEDDWWEGIIAPLLNKLLKSLLWEAIG
jgi:hypothetical protein